MARSREGSSQAQITTGGFDIQVGNSFNTDHGRGIRHDLRLPPAGELRQVIFTSDFKKFMHAVATDPSSKRVFQVRNPKADVTISYDPNGRFWTGGHLVYTGANIVDDNPVFHSLKRKAAQLKKSRYPGIRGVIMCDGGCEMLGKHSSNWSEFSLADVVNKLTSKNRSIGFVAVIALVHDRSGHIGRGHYSPALSVWVSPNGAGQKEALIPVLDSMVKGLPIFETSAGNALSRVMSGKPKLGSHFGGFQMGGDQYMKISAIGLLQLLAGTITYEEFAERHGFKDRNGFANAFANAVRNGRVIRNCKIESGGEQDDDWIVFEFGKPDPALASFISKQAKTTSASGGSGA